MKTNRKFVVFALMLLAVVMIISACRGGGETPAPVTPATPAPTPAAQPAQPTPTPEPEGPTLAPGQISYEPIHVRIFAPAGAATTRYEEMVNLVQHSERTNIFVTWEQPTFEHHDERFNVILASGDLPDMFWNIRGSNFNAIRAAGMVADVSPYVNETYSPHLMARIAEFPGIDASFVEPDGSIFFLPMIDGLSANDPLILRGDWLEALDLPLPETLDQWQDFWEGVRDNDLNGMGNAIPLTVVNAAGRRNYFRTWVSAFEMNDRFFVDVQNNNQVTFANIDPRYVEFLEWANMLWNEDILDREFASRSSAEFGQLNAQNRNASWRGLLNGQLNGPMLSLPNEIEGFNLVGTPPIRSANGLQLHPGVENLVRINTIGGFISASSDYVRELVQFVDWFYDFTPPYGGGFVNIFGFEDLTFEWGPDGTEFFYTEYVLNNPEGFTPAQVLTRHTTRVNSPGFVDPIGSFRMWHPNTAEAFGRINEFYWDSLAWVLPNLAITDDEARIIRNIMADVDTYVDEMVNNFIMGRTPLSYFPNFVANVEAMGIQQVLDIYNSALEAHLNR